MTFKLVFIGDKNSDYIKHIKFYFSNIQNVEIINNNLVEYLDKQNVCFVSTISSLGLMNNDADISYQAMFPNIQGLVKKKLLDSNTYVFRNNIKPEVINNNPYLPVGSACLVPLGNKSNSFLCGAPTVSYRQEVFNSSKNYYYFIKAILRLVNNYNFSFSSNKIEKIIIPEFTEKKEDIQQIFDGYFDALFNLGNDFTNIKTSTLYYYRAPLVSNSSSFIRKKKSTNITNNQISN